MLQQKVAPNILGCWEKETPDWGDLENLKLDRKAWAIHIPSAATGTVILRFFMADGNPRSSFRPILFIFALKSKKNQICRWVWGYPSVSGAVSGR